ncbi:MAG: glycosyltransferase family 4 protein [Pseudomonadota bacterium]
MKILYHHRVASKDGQYVHIDELTRALKARGHELIMVGPKFADEKEFGADGGFVDWLKRHMPKAVYELMEFGYSLLAYWKLRRAVLEHRPDCLYERYTLFMPAGVWLKKRFGLPMLLEVNAPLRQERAKHSGGLALQGLARWSERYCWKHADRTLPVTRVLGDMVVEEGGHAEHVRVIPNGVDWDKFRDRPSRDQAKEALGLGGRLVLGFTGFVRDWHGLDRAVDLVARSPERHLLIVGDGPARQTIEARAQELGVTDQITVTGIVGRSEVAGYVGAFDVALQPDVVAYASPLKLFEYLAMGSAVVAPDTANIREVVTHAETGWLFDPDQPAGLLGAVEHLCEEPALREALGQRARESIDERGFTWAQNAEVVEGLFRDLGVRD